MSDRFAVGPLLMGLFSRLRRRTEGDDASPAGLDWLAVVVLILVPLLVAALMLWKQQVLVHPDQLIAGFSLLAGSLIAAFSLLAAWRTRLTEQGTTVEAPEAQRIDEAVAHSLTAAVGCMAGAVLMVVLVNLPAACGTLLHWTKVSLSALGAGLGAFVALSFLIATNLVWDAYCEANGIERRIKVRHRSL